MHACIFAFIWHDYHFVELVRIKTIFNRVFKLYLTMTTWTIIEFRAWIESGCPKNDDVRKLDLSNNQLAFLPVEIGKLVTLQTLVASYFV